MSITPEEFFKKLEAIEHSKKIDILKKLEAIEHSKKIDILKKIAAFCHKEYNDNSDWNSWVFKNFLWSEWELKFDQQIYLIGNAKALLDRQTIAHVKVFCGFISNLKPVVRVTSTLFNLRTGETAFYDKSNYDDDVYCSLYKQDEITFICNKTDEIAETISNFIKTINPRDKTDEIVEAISNIKFYQD